MADLRMTTTAGVGTVLKETAVEAFKASLRGEALTPDCAGYDEGRAI